MKLADNIYNSDQVGYSTCFSMLITVLLIVQQFNCRAGINESLRLQPTQIRTLDSIAPNSQLFFTGGQGNSLFLLGDNGDMSIYSLNESFNTNWSWNANVATIAFMALFDVQAIDEDRGKCLAADRLGSGKIYRFTYEQGQTVDSALLDLPKPPYHIVQDMATRNSQIAFTARVQTRTKDTLFAYLVDTASGVHDVWEVPISDDIEGVGSSTIRLVDTNLVVLWKESMAGFHDRVRLIIYGLESKSILHSIFLADVNSHRFEWQRVWVDKSQKHIGIIAIATNREKPEFGLQYWRINVESGSVDSTTEFLPEYTYIDVGDVLITDNQKLLGVGSVSDVDPHTMEFVESSSRGVPFEYDSSGGLVKFMSMKDRRPTTLTSLYQDGDEMLLAGRNENDSSFIATINKETSVGLELKEPVTHDKENHIAWVTVGGEIVDQPSNGVFVELWQCSAGCRHSDLNVFINEIKIGSNQNRK